MFYRVCVCVCVCVCVYACVWKLPASSGCVCHDCLLGFSASFCDRLGVWGRGGAPQYGRARDRTRISPFVRRGVQAGCLDAAKVAAGAHCGGKLDDISTIICRVEGPSSSPSTGGGFRNSDGQQ
jgi:hypothetical protein